MNNNRFKNDMGVRLTKGLFFETTSSDKSAVLYTLKDEDHEYEGRHYPSLRVLYLQTADPTEYRFATTHLDGWAHWEMLLQCKWFETYIARWRRELELKIKSESLSRIMAMSKTPTKEQFQANKYLLEKGWEPKEGQTKRGRPSKDEITKAAHEQVQTVTRLSEDFERLGIKLHQ